ncbi:MAG TPA: alpha/beta fold hydrolase [Tepidiformaceae bacterium]|nr:alpha/beta fold hydrolase [Tepidiformaceae bacterium]
MPTFERGGVTLYYEDIGDPEAPAIVLLHGFTVDHRMWRPVVEAFAADYRVIAPDLRGHGASDAPEDLDTYSMDAYAADIAALLDHLGVDLCALVGCSFGGMVALQVAVDSPERIAGLVLTDTSAAFEHPDYDAKYGERETRLAELEDVVERFGTAEVGKRAAASVADPFLAEGVRRRYTAMRRDGWLGAARVRRERPNLLPLIGERLTMPVLVCIGEDDPVRSACEVMVRELSGARFLTFKECGHGIPSLRPEAFAREALQFFADIEDEKDIARQRTVN